MVLIHLTIARFKNCSVVSPLELVVVIGGGFALGAGVVWVWVGTAGAAATGVSGGAAAGADVFCLPHPAATAPTIRNNKGIVFGRQPGNRTKSKSAFIAGVEFP